MKLKKMKFRLPEKKEGSKENPILAWIHSLSKTQIIYILTGCVGVLMLISLLCMPRVLEDKDLAALGYSKEAITAIRKQNLQNTILKNNYYSENMEAEILAGTFDKDYAPLYTVTETTTDKDKRLFDVLQYKGYSQETVIHLFASLQDYEITPLLVFDYQENVDTYINDCQQNAATNSPTNFVLSGTYFTPYDQVVQENNLSESMLVNKTFYLPDGFAPASIEDISARYGASGLSLESTAYAAARDMIDAGNGLGLRMFISNAYRSYDEQAETYDYYVNALGAETADLRAARPGFSEHQTGLALDMAAVTEEGVTFGETQEYQWLVGNAATYGWLLHYPEGKESITGYQFEPWHYRYVGPELAQKVVDSQMTYDEYYLLYLYSWPTPNPEDATQTPSPTEETIPSPAAETTEDPAEESPATE